MRDWHGKTQRREVSCKTRGIHFTPKIELKKKRRSNDEIITDHVHRFMTTVYPVPKLKSSGFLNMTMRSLSLGGLIKSQSNRAVDVAHGCETNKCAATV